MCGLKSVTAVVRPSFRQFYVRRGDAPWASDEVSASGYEARLEAIDGFVYIGTEMYGSPTRVTVEVLDSEPPVAPRAERHADSRIDGSGPLAVLSWGETEPDLVVDVPAGTLRVRASWFGTEEAAKHPDWDLGGDDESPESVTLQVWPERP
jgi:hypothetical protein